MPSREYYEALWRAVPQGAQPSHLALRSRFLAEHVRAGERVLDVGCGDGRFAAALTGAGAVVVAADVAEEPLRRARALTGGLDTKLLDVDGQWPFADSYFDVVWAGEVIEHVADTAAWLSELRRVLRSGGKLLASTPAHGRATRARLALSERFFAERFDPLGDHLRFYSRRTLSLLLHEFGFEHVHVHARGGVPGARTLLLAHATRARF